MSPCPQTGLQLPTGAPKYMHWYEACVLPSPLALETSTIQIVHAMSTQAPCLATQQHLPAQVLQFHNLNFFLKKRTEISSTKYFLTNSWLRSHPFTIMLSQFQKCLNFWVIVYEWSRFNCVDQVFAASVRYTFLAISIRYRTWLLSAAAEFWNLLYLDAHELVILM